jgi:hypothetical protein
MLFAVMMRTGFCGSVRKCDSPATASPQEQPGKFVELPAGNLKKLIQRLQGFIQRPKS